jgi:hypothetical protein
MHRKSLTEGYPITGWEALSSYLCKRVRSFVRWSRMWDFLATLKEAVTFLPQELLGRVGGILLLVVLKNGLGYITWVGGWVGGCLHSELICWGSSGTHWGLGYSPPRTVKFCYKTIFVEYISKKMFINLSGYLTAGWNIFQDAQLIQETVLTQQHLPLFVLILSGIGLKGQCHEIFDFWFFYESVSPKPLSIPLGSFWIFSKSSIIKVLII